MAMISRTFATFPCVILLITLSLTSPCHAQNNPQDYVDAHNAARAAVGVPNIEWNDQVAAYAQQYAQQRIGDCALQHSGGPYGENIAWGSDGSLTGTDAVQMWVNEKADYDYDTNTCAPGKECGHYTQVVWRNSIHLGCARVQCYSGGTFITCNYDPPGNWNGEKPY